MNPRPISSNEIKLDFLNASEGTWSPSSPFVSSNINPLPLEETRNERKEEIEISKPNVIDLTNNDTTHEKTTQSETFIPINDNEWYDFSNHIGKLLEHSINNVNKAKKKLSICIASPNYDAKQTFDKIQDFYKVPSPPTCPEIMSIYFNPGVQDSQIEDFLNKIITLAKTLFITNNRNNLGKLKVVLFGAIIFFENHYICVQVQCVSSEPKKISVHFNFINTLSRFEVYSEKVKSLGEKVTTLWNQTENTIEGNAFTLRTPNILNENIQQVETAHCGPLSVAITQHFLEKGHPPDKIKLESIYKNISGIRKEHNLILQKITDEENAEARKRKYDGEKPDDEKNPAKKARLNPSQAKPSTSQCIDWIMMSQNVAAQLHNYLQSHKGGQYINMVPTSNPAISKGFYIPGHVPVLLSTNGTVWLDIYRPFKDIEGILASPPTPRILSPLPTVPSVILPSIPKEEAPLIHTVNSETISKTNSKSNSETSSKTHRFFQQSHQPEKNVSLDSLIRTTKKKNLKQYYSDPTYDYENLLPLAALLEEENADKFANDLSIWGGMYPELLCEELILIKFINTLDFNNRSHVNHFFYYMKSLTSATEHKKIPYLSSISFKPIDVLTHIESFIQKPTTQLDDIKKKQAIALIHYIKKAIPPEQNPSTIISTKK